MAQTSPRRSPSPPPRTDRPGPPEPWHRTLDDGAAPEHCVSCSIQTEVDEDGPSVQLTCRWPFTGEVRFLDSTQVEATVRLLQEALPHLREAERQAEADWPDAEDRA